MIARAVFRGLILIVGFNFPVASSLAMPPEPHRVEVLNREAVMPDPGIQFSCTLDLDTVRTEPAPELANPALRAALTEGYEAMAADRKSSTLSAGKWKSVPRRAMYPGQPGWSWAPWRGGAQTPGMAFRGPW